MHSKKQKWSMSLQNVVNIRIPVLYDSRVGSDGAPSKAGTDVQGQ